MGSVCRMNETNRAAAVLRLDPDFLAPLRRFIGAAIEAVDLSVNDPIGTISALLTVRMPDGTTEELDGAVLAEDAESGVLGFDLQDRYPLDDLRRMLETAIADPDSGLDRYDRDEQRLLGEPRGRDPDRQDYGVVPQ
jgi:hypothetical protein